MFLLWCGKGDPNILSESVGEEVPLFHVSCTTFTILSKLLT